jgi:hypothetical protein
MAIAFDHMEQNAATAPITATPTNTTSHHNHNDHPNIPRHTNGIRVVATNGTPKGETHRSQEAQQLSTDAVTTTSTATAARSTSTIT